MKNAIRLAFIFVLLSLILGPMITAPLFNHPSGLDCYDPTWGSTPIAERAASYDNAALSIKLVSPLMILVGIGLLIRLFHHARRTKQLQKTILPAIFILFTLIGYCLTILVASLLKFC